jgi:hypothetical protein
MNYSLLYKPYHLIERLALEISRTRRLRKLKNKPGAVLQLGHLDSLELLELINNDKSVNSAPVIFDVGSNTGTWTLLAKSIFPSAAIHAFEPLAEHVLAFYKTCGGMNDIFIHQYCIGNENSTGTIHVSSFTDSSSLLEATPLEFEHFRIKRKG